MGTLLLLLVAASAYLLSAAKILPQHERGIVFRLGRLLDQPKGPGLVLVFWPVDAMVRISLRPQLLELPPKDFATRDDGPLTLAVTVSLRVNDPTRAVTEVSNYLTQTEDATYNALRSIVAESTYDDAREDTGELGLRMQSLLEPQVAPWGVVVDNVTVREPDGPGSTPHVPQSPPEPRPAV
jgi:regulator of protease activity HflC (stomatin/prohibitin superfamily)